MSKETGGAAFPNPYFSNSGMTLRDYFAAKAMQGMTSTPAFYKHGWLPDDMAKQAYMLADAMLKAREA